MLYLKKFIHFILMLMIGLRGPRCYLIFNRWRFCSRYKKQVYDYCNDQIKAGEEVQIQELSGELPASTDGTSFFDFTREHGYELEESFPGDRSTVRKLTKYVGAGGGLNISFDSLLMGERVFYDPETDTLTIKGTPPNLRDQLTRKQ